MNKTYFFELEDWEKEYIKSNLSEELVFNLEKIDSSSASNYQDAEIISVFIYSKLDRETIDKLPNLRLITTRSMGFDHIDVAYCKEKGIKVCNVPKYGSHTVAEHAFSLILALSRKIVPSVERTRSGEFGNDGLEGFDLFGKTFGLIGTGHIGKNVAELALAFGMKVLAYNRHDDPELITKGVRFASLDEVLQNSDVVSLHLPHTKETEHIINMETIQKFKKGAILINTARGALAETQAIAEGLEKGILSGVGLDVLEEEGDLREERELLSVDYLRNVDIKTQLLNHVLLTQKDVIITPHNAFNSREALQEILATTIANINGYINNSTINTIE